jgi:radical SAM superfamily enzyme YgiQ (UPF0313 family)
MRITFIRPGLTGAKMADALEPIVFALLANLTPPDVEMTLYDDRIEAIPSEEPTDLVALSVETFTARRAYAIAARYRERDIPVVMGGFHPTLCPEEALRHTDSIVIGEAENVWAQVVQDAQDGRLQPRYQAEPPADPLHITFDRRIFQGKRYPPIRLVQWGRGCGHECDFCAIQLFYQRRTTQRPVADVVAEIERSRAKYALFVDDNLLAHPTGLRDLAEALIPLKFTWAAQISLNVARDPQLLRLLARSGCCAVLIGFESLHPDNLRQMHKSWNRSFQEYDAAIKAFYDHGIMICGTFVFGYDHDTPDSFKYCLEFTLRHKLCLAHFNPLIPYPGTALYDRLHQEGRLINNPWWLSPDFRYGQAMFHPRGMTADELTEGCFGARKDFNSINAILRRAFHFNANCKNWKHAWLYALANWISRTEIYHKQGALLGHETDLDQESL